MANLQHLIAALGKVADAYAPDPNDGDPLDDSRSYPDDDNQVSDFRRRKPLGTVMLLERLEQQAEEKADQDQSLAARRLRIKAAPRKLQKKSEKLLEMRRKSAAAEYELKLNRQLEQETKRLQEARVKLHKENLTATGQMELEANTENMAAWASQYCKEAASDWREEARAAFGSQYQPPVKDRRPKTA